MKTIAVYPGSFDPITNGHLSLVKRGLLIFDKIIVAIAENPDKKPVFTVNERLEMTKQAILETISEADRVEVDIFKGLLVNYVQKKGAN
ncbi:MAG TPA: pantetheine-phosphate adenylyltransferase, partial [Candidatus Desulfofervidus auxilii]|nr:pantetheine-phosphate adenylyltransferase [Candidatus Desulfofervidus auxilii]